jgi:nitronate monooxygenase
MAAKRFLNGAKLQSHYPFTKKPFIVSAPMRLISTPKLALTVSRAGGLGFIGAGSDINHLPAQLDEAASLLSQNPIPNTPDGMLPLGIGIINWGASLSIFTQEVQKWKPVAVWFFAPRSPADLVTWTQAVRDASPDTKVWIQIGTVASALEVAQECKPDVLVVQGSDAGGHGLARSAGLMALLPETSDALADRGLSIPLIGAGGIADARGVSAALALGASGVCMGTRFLACPEAQISQGYRRAVLEAQDGGVNTARTNVYDHIRGTTEWPEIYNGRGVINKSYVDSEAGMSHEENKRLYAAEESKGDEGWGVQGRMTTYAGTAVGLVKKEMGAREVVEEILTEVSGVIGGVKGLCE